MEILFKANLRQRVVLLAATLTTLLVLLFPVVETSHHAWAPATASWAELDSHSQRTFLTDAGNRVEKLSTRDLAFDGRLRSAMVKGAGNETLDAVVQEAHSWTAYFERRYRVKTERGVVEFAAIALLASAAFRLLR